MKHGKCLSERNLGLDSCYGADFGSSCFVTDHLTSYVQSRSYRAPEASSAPNPSLCGHGCCRWRSTFVPIPPCSVTYRISERILAIAVQRHLIILSD